MGLFGKRKLKPEEVALIANSDCAFQIESVLYPNVKLSGQRLADIGGRVLKGTMCVGDAFEAYGKTFKILKIQKVSDLLQSIDTDDYVGLAVAYEPITYWKLPFKKGVYKIVTSGNPTSDNLLAAKRTIYTEGYHVPGSIYEEVSVELMDGVWYYITLSMVDRYGAGGHKEKVPKNCLTKDGIDENKLLKYIANTHLYMETMSQYR